MNAYVFDPLTISDPYHEIIQPRAESPRLGAGGGSENADKIKAREVADMIDRRFERKCRVPITADFPLRVYRLVCRLFVV